MPNHIGTLSELMTWLILKPALNLRAVVSLYIKAKGAKLQRALIQYFLDYNTAAGYTEYLPPLMVNEASAWGTGQLPDKEGQMYHMPADNFYMIPTAEVPRNEYLPR